MTPQEFITTYSSAIVTSTMLNTLFPSVVMAQACLETGYGKSTVGSAKNLFGIKATGTPNKFWDGSSTAATTVEYKNGVRYIVSDGFRSYKSFADSISDHTFLLTNEKSSAYKRYAPVREATTAEAQAQALQNCGYATDPNYANKLIQIINKYNLKELDTKKKIRRVFAIGGTVSAVLILSAILIYIIKKN